MGAGRRGLWGVEIAVGGYSVGAGRLADGPRGVVVAVDGIYTTYGASTGLVEVYEGGGLVYVNAGAFGVFCQASL